MNDDTGGYNIRLVFKNALNYYNNGIQNLKNKKDVFINAVIEEDIKDNKDKISKLITDLESNNYSQKLDQNREVLCSCLRGYISYLETTKHWISMNLKISSLPNIDLTKTNNEIELSEKILKESCQDHNL